MKTLFKPLFLPFFLVLLFSLLIPQFEVLAQEDSFTLINEDQIDESGNLNTEKPKDIFQRIERVKANGHTFEKVDLFTNTRRSAARNYIDAVRRGVILDLDVSTVAKQLEEKPERLLLELPAVEERKTFTMELVRVNFFSPGFFIQTSGNPNNITTDQHGIHYHGVIQGGERRFAAISIFENEVVGLIVTEDGNYTLGKLADSERGHILYKESDLQNAEQFECLTVSDGIGYTPEQLAPRPRRDAGDCVDVYIEVHDNVYTNSSSSLRNTLNFIIGLFSQSVILYTNESINIRISHVFIWTTPSGYTGNAEAVRDAWQANNNSIGGADLAHFVERSSSGAGGIAAGFSGICAGNTDASVCVTQTALTFMQVPTYSRQVKVFTHEMGHLMGSRHTHACVWNGNNTVIDSCADEAEGDCQYPDPGGQVPPGFQGTIMSYCDTDGAAPINFNLGFGTQPGNVIRNTIANANCLDVCPDDNYLCIYATAIGCGGSYSGNTTGTTRVDTPPVCGDGGSNEDGVWFSFSPNTGVYATIQTDANNTDFNTQLSVYSSNSDCYGTFSCVTGDDDSGTGDDALVQFAAQSGTNYYIYLDGFAGATGNYELDVSCCDLPEAKCKDADVYLDENFGISFEASVVDDGSTADCGLDTITVSPNAVFCVDKSGQLVTLTVTDIEGNSDQCTATVTAVDTISPTITCKDTVVFLDVNLEAVVSPLAVRDSSWDNCSGTSLSLDKDNFNCSDFGDNIVTLTITDGSNNTGDCTATITIANDPDQALCCLDGETENHFIQSISELIGQQTNPSGDDNGFGDYTNITFTAISPYFPYFYFLFTPGNTGPSDLQNWELYIDWDSDSLFTPTEKMIDYCTAGPFLQVIPLAGKPMGTFRMRLIMQSDKDNDGCQPGELPDPLCGSIGEGEVEDYEINKPYAYPIQAADLPGSVQDRVHVFPNPFTDELSVVYDTGIGEDVTWELLDIDGRLIRSGVNASQDGYFKLVTKDLASGLYLLKVKTSSDEITKRVIKQ